MRKKAADMERCGDKENSKYFEEYLLKIYDRREKNGLDDLLIKMRAVVIQVSPGDGIKYMEELYLMTPYRFHRAFVNSTHKIYVLRIKPEFPDYILIEPLSEDYRDFVFSINSLFPRGREKINTRYLGEIYQTRDLKETKKVLEADEIRFMPDDVLKNAFLKNPNFRFTDVSYFTNNIVGYTESEMVDYDKLLLGEEMILSEEEIARLRTMDELQRHFHLYDLIFGIDHLATRVFAGSREDALLEFLSMSNYYFWGAYNIDDLNSSTNICRNPQISYELHSPAKVFTANNNPFYTQSIDKIPSPTEDFVRNFGRRMHHIAYEVEDGEREDGEKNIDYVVGKLISENIPFLAQIIGECKDFPDLKQIFSKSSQYSQLITEYVQRCKGFAGFFAKTNVAYLTQAAGEDEALKSIL